MEILINVSNQKLRVTNTRNNIISGTQKFVKFTFDLGEDWDGLLTFAQFRQNGEAYNVYLDEENSVFLPPEIQPGTCTVMLYGSNEEVIGTTNYLTFTIDENILVSDAQSTDISLSLYNQLVTKVNDLSNKLVQLENGEVVIIGGDVDSLGYYKRYSVTGGSIWTGTEAVSASTVIYFRPVSVKSEASQVLLVRGLYSKNSEDGFDVICFGEVGEALRAITTREYDHIEVYTAGLIETDFSFDILIGEQYGIVSDIYHTKRNLLDQIQEIKNSIDGVLGGAS